SSKSREHAHRPISPQLSSRNPRLRRRRAALEARNSGRFQLGQCEKMGSQPQGWSPLIFSAGKKTGLNRYLPFSGEKQTVLEIRKWTARSCQSCSPFPSVVCSDASIDLKPRLCPLISSTLHWARMSRSLTRLQPVEFLGECSTPMAIP